MGAKLLQSQTLTWAASTTLPVPLTFLDAARGYKAPVITGLDIVMQLTFNTGASGGPGRTLAMVFSRVLVVDGAGERVNLRGSSLRIANQMEYGNNYRDPINTTTNQTGATNNSILRIPVVPGRCRRPNDFGIPLGELLDGGRIELQTGAATLATGYVTITAGTFYIVAEVEEQEVEEAKSRIIFRDQAISVTDYNYDINGALRWSLFYNGEANEKNQAAWSAQKLTSNTFEYASLQDYYLKDYSQRRGAWGMRNAAVGDSTTSQPTEDVVQTGQAVPVWVARHNHKLPKLPRLSSLHVKTDGSITTADLPQLITSVVTERNPSATAKTLKIPPGQLGLLKAHGFTKMASGAKMPASKVAPAAAKIMPLKFRPPTR